MSKKLLLFIIIADTIGLLVAGFLIYMFVIAPVEDVSMEPSVLTEGAIEVEVYE